jgi:hypothetical protein
LSNKSEVSALAEHVDSVLKSMSSEVLRMIGVSVQYSVYTDHFEALKKQLEAAGWMVGINDQTGKTLHITLTYLRNWN